MGKDNQFSITDSNNSLELNENQKDNIIGTGSTAIIYKINSNNVKKEFKDDITLDQLNYQKDMINKIHPNFEVEIQESTKQHKASITMPFINGSHDISNEKIQLAVRDLFNTYKLIITDPVKENFIKTQDNEIILCDYGSVLDLNKEIIETPKDALFEIYQNYLKSKFSKFNLDSIIKNETKKSLSEVYNLLKSDETYRTKIQSIQHDIQSKLDHQSSKNVDPGLQPISPFLGKKLDFGKFIPNNKQDNSLPENLFMKNDNSNTKIKLDFDK
ncbi:MAG: hypothetical protein EP298_00075 [Gammaproteobacteria bacterium]|nr:MAG: hypothetical protein EP298_00075 [Gammaproteobacteria bacterium]UTW41589.1 hypothetical protein KFE69_08720 [bacterium SCSIO 12844]